MKMNIIWVQMKMNEQLVGINPNINYFVDQITYQMMNYLNRVTKIIQYKNSITMAILRVNIKQNKLQYLFNNQQQAAQHLFHFQQR